MLWHSSQLKVLTPTITHLPQHFLIYHLTSAGSNASIAFTSALQHKDITSNIAQDHDKHSPTHPVNRNSQSHKYKYSKCQSEHNVLDWHAAAVVELTLEHNAAMWVSQVWLLQPASSQQMSVTSGTNGLLHQAANSCVSQNWDSSVWKQWQARLPASLSAYPACISWSWKCFSATKSYCSL